MSGIHSKDDDRLDGMIHRLSNEVKELKSKNESFKLLLENADDYIDDLARELNATSDKSESIYELIDLSKAFRKLIDKAINPKSSN